MKETICNDCPASWRQNGPERHASILRRKGESENVETKPHQNSQLEETASLSTATVCNINVDFLRHEHAGIAVRCSSGMRRWGLAMRYAKEVKAPAGPVDCRPNLSWQRATLGYAIIHGCRPLPLFFHSSLILPTRHACPSIRFRLPDLTSPASNLAHCRFQLTIFLWLFQH
jgi:hypothetical protein